MEEHYGLTREMYQAVAAVVDDRIEKSLVRQGYEQLAKGQQRLGMWMDRVEDALERLAEAQARTEERLNNLIDVVGDMQDTQGILKGRQLELFYRERVGAYFGPLLRRVRVVSPIEIEDDLETHLSREEFRDLLLADLVIRGYPRHLSDAPQVWLVVEISSVVDRHDVERAQRRAEHLNKAGYAALPAVAGEDTTKGAQSVAEDKGVLMVLDGRTSFWEQALERVLAK